jgi:hypothetical protein
MNKYLVIILLRDTALASQASLFWEQFLLIEADDEEGARQSAEVFAQQQQFHHKADDRQYDWTYDSIFAVRHLSEPLAPCLEIYSRFFRASDLEGVRTPLEDFDFSK